MAVCIKPYTYVGDNLKKEMTYAKSGIMASMFENLVLVFHLKTRTITMYITCDFSERDENVDIMTDEDIVFTIPVPKVDIKKIFTPNMYVLA